MKGTLKIASLLACLFAASACDSTISKLSSAIRRGWEGLHSEKTPDADPEADLSGLDLAPGSPLTLSEQTLVAKTREVQTIAKAQTTDPADRDKKVLAKMEELNKAYPLFEPISRDSLEKTVWRSAPEQIGDYEKVNQMVVQQFPANEKVPREELIPGLWFQLPRGYFMNLVQYQNPRGQVINLIIEDRGNLGGWARAAHWYYLRQGEVGTDEQKRYEFSGTVEKYGHTWVIWKSKQDGKKAFLSCWKDRWQINIAAADNLDAFEAIDPDWLKTIR